MDSGFCVRVLLLSLIFGQKTIANASGGRKLYSKQDETLSHGYRPASNYETLTQPRASQATSRLSQSGLLDNSKYSAPVGLQGQSGHYGRQVAGYSQPRSVPSYKPTSPLSSNPRQTFEQRQKAIYRHQGGVGATASPSKSYGSGVVSSGEIEMHSSAASPQQPRSSANVYQTKDGMWNLPPSKNVEGSRGASVLDRLTKMYAAAKLKAKQSDSLGHIRWPATAGSNAQSPDLHKRIVPPASSSPASSYYTRRQQLGIPANPPQQRPSVPAKPPQQAGYSANLPKRKTSVRILSPQSDSRLRFGIPPSRATGVSDTAKPYQKHLVAHASSAPLPNTDARDRGFGSNKWVTVEPPKWVPLYKYGGKRPQLGSNRDK